MNIEQAEAEIIAEIEGIQKVIKIEANKIIRHYRECEPWK